jgi:hypothetical protein
MIYEIVMEDAGRYLPHSPIGREYLHYVIKGTSPHPITGKQRPNTVFSGTRSECEDFVKRMEERKAF